MIYLVVLPFALVMLFAMITSYLAFGLRGMIFIVTFTITLSIIVIVLALKIEEIMGGAL